MNSRLSLKELVFTGLGRREQTQKLEKTVTEVGKKIWRSFIRKSPPQMIILLTREYLRNLNVDYK